MSRVLDNQAAVAISGGSTESGHPAGIVPAKTPLAEAKVLLNAVFPPEEYSASISAGLILSASSPQGVAALTSEPSGPSMPYFLEGATLAQAKASQELVALQTVVQAKETAVSLAWGARRGAPALTSPTGEELPRRGWGDAFLNFPESEMWKTDSGIAGGGSGRAEWNAWHGSVSGLVEGMTGVLAGLVDSALVLRSALEAHLESR